MLYLQFLENYRSFIKNTKYKVQKEEKDFFVCMHKKVPKNKEGIIYLVGEAVII